MSLHSFEGASGEHYEYLSLNPKSREAFPMSGGNYVFTCAGSKGEVIICAGESESLWIDFVSAGRWELARKKYGATAAYVRLNHDHAARRLEQLDLIEKHHPPMNVEPLKEQAS